MVIGRFAFLSPLWGT